MPKRGPSASPEIASWLSHLHPNYLHGQSHLGRRQSPDYAQCQSTKSWESRETHHRIFEITQTVFIPAHVTYKLPVAPFVHLLFL